MINEQEMEIQMSNRLYATDRLDIVAGVEGLPSLDRAQIIRRAEIMRAEAFSRAVANLWRWVRALGQAGDATRPAGLDDHTLADIGVTRTQIPGFAAREVEAAQDIAHRTRALRTPATVA